MKKQWMFIVLAVGAMALLSSQVVFAQPSGEGRHKMMGKKGGEKKEYFEKMFKDLNLTPEQKQKMEEQKKQHMETAKQLRGQMKQKKNEMKDELQKDQLDMAKINQIHEQLKALLVEQEDNRLKAVLELRSILTSEQFVQFHQRMKEGMGKRKGMEGKKRFEGEEEPPAPENDEE